MMTKECSQLKRQKNVHMEYEKNLIKEKEETKCNNIIKRYTND